jgi:hypothetical protein
MTVTIPLALVLGCIVAAMVRWARLPAWQAVITAVFGFTLAATGLAPYVQHFITMILGF